MAEANDTPTCSMCGNGFEQRKGQGRPFQKCPDCRSKPSYQRKQYAPRQCQWCAEEFVPLRVDTRFCSKRCVYANADSRRPPRDRSKDRPTTRPANCKFCGSRFDSYTSTGAPGGWTRCCSDRCARGHRSQRMRAVREERDALRRIASAWAWKPSQEVVDETAALVRISRYQERKLRKPCECCGAEILCIADGRKKLCDGCRERRQRDSAKRYRKSPAGRARRKREKAVRRARVAIESEAIDPIAVFDRDRWTCQLCGKRTPKRLRGKSVPDAPELDHIIPLALGGGHLWSNVQCACRSCNGAKGAKTQGQLGLPLAA